jgi:diaminopimelate epimerase
VRLPTDVVSMRVEDELDAGAVQVRVRDGARPVRGAPSASSPSPGEAASSCTLWLSRPAPTAAVNTVYLGNPHCVVIVDTLDRADFLRRAPAALHARGVRRGHERPVRTPCRRSGHGGWIWERGAGETLASGSSACAVAAVAVRRGFVDGGPITVSMPGGSVSVKVGADYDVELLGPAQLVYEAVSLPGRLG